MLIPGKNRFVNIISSLVCLAALVETQDWARSMLDVQWVVQEVLTAKRAGRYVPVCFFNCMHSTILFYSDDDTSNPVSESNKSAKRKAAQAGPGASKRVRRRH